MTNEEQLKETRDKNVAAFEGAIGELIYKTRRGDDKSNDLKNLVSSYADYIAILSVLNDMEFVKKLEERGCCNDDCCVEDHNGFTSQTE